MSIDMTTVKEITHNNKEVVKIEDSNGNILWQKQSSVQITVDYAISNAYYKTYKPYTVANNRLTPYATLSDIETQIKSFYPNVTNLTFNSITDYARIRNSSSTGYSYKILDQSGNQVALGYANSTSFVRQNWVRPSNLEYYTGKYSTNSNFSSSTVHFDTITTDNSTNTDFRTVYNVTLDISSAPVQRTLTLQGSLSYGRFGFDGISPAKPSSYPYTTTGYSNYLFCAFENARNYSNWIIKINGTTVSTITTSTTGTYNTQIDISQYTNISVAASSDATFNITAS